MTENDLLEQARRGDRAALERLVRQLDARVLNLAHRLLGEREAAQDVRQQAFLRLLSSLDGFAGRAALETWIHRVVVNLCRDRARARAALVRRERASLLADFSRGAGALPPEQEVMKKETGRRVLEALGALPESEREVVVLRHYHDLPFARIAEILDLPPSTVKTRMARGLERLARRLGAFAPPAAAPARSLTTENPR